MNTLAGWGFATAEAFAQHFALAPEHIKRSVRSRGGRHVTPEEFEAYAATLTRVPTVHEVRRHFLCSRPSAYNYLRKVIAIMARRTPA